MNYILNVLYFKYTLLLENYFFNQISYFSPYPLQQIRLLQVERSFISF
ncbi:hypothetical protein LEP1GSC060_0771 [Leptospira weilii serovar Ranarum str. ICFT]|uniref:Uncharacterized protein n=1 Tax=Leptospira weilii serovar Ranarum str. ICFT TaxID=1218598 RepID=N1WM77_9LEPT|nr:hypothetical protein LEP1GSC060_0771 [Leptospira weilii serovar Ranarum str. ICFT]